MDIDIGAFAGAGLISVTGGTSVKSIGEGAFKDTVSLKSVGNMGKRITSIAKEAFKRSGITSFDVSDSQLSELPSNVFRGCSSLKNFTYPVSGSLVTIDGMAFGETGFEEVTIPDSVTSVGTNAFYACMSLRSAHVGSGLTEMRTGLFNFCKNLEEVTFSDTLKNIGYKAFIDCVKLTTITLPDSVKSISDKAFQGCSSLTNINLPNGLTSIGYEAFRESGLEVLSFPSTMTSVVSNLCYKCKSLAEVHIGEGVKTIGDSSFEGAESLHTVTLGESSKLSEIGKRAFKSCSALKSFPFDEALTSTGYSAFQGSGLSGDLLIPETFLEIGSSTFAYTAISSVVLPTGLTSVPSNLFMGCSQLVEVIFGESTNIRSIDNYAFYGTSLINVVVPEGVTSIGYYSFFGCASLTEIVLPSTLTQIASGAFLNTRSLRKMYIGSSGTVNFTPDNFDMKNIDASFTAYAKKSVESITGTPFFILEHNGVVMCNEGFGVQDQSDEYFGCALCPIDTFSDAPTRSECEACSEGTGTCSPGETMCLPIEDTISCRPTAAPTKSPTLAPTRFMPTSIPTYLPTRNLVTSEPTVPPSALSTSTPTSETGANNDDATSESIKSEGKNDSSQEEAVGITFGVLAVIACICAFFTTSRFIARIQKLKKKRWRVEAARSLRRTQFIIRRLQHRRHRQRRHRPSPPRCRT